MIEKRLIKEVPNASSHIAKNVVLQVLGLVSNIILMITISLFLSSLIDKKLLLADFFTYGIIIILCIGVKVCTTYFANIQSYLASKAVKNILRGRIYDKVVKLGSKYTKKLSSAELLQISVEGVE